MNATAVRDGEARRAVPVRRCADCELDLGEVLRALACPRFGQSRNGVESRCAAFRPKPAPTFPQARPKDRANGPKVSNHHHDHRSHDNG